jgi:hypothetical protein
MACNLSYLALTFPQGIAHLSDDDQKRAFSIGDTSHHYRSFFIGYPDCPDGRSAQIPTFGKARTFVLQHPDQEG